MDVLLQDKVQKGSSAQGEQLSDFRLDSTVPHMISLCPFHYVLVRHAEEAAENIRTCVERGPTCPCCQGVGAARVTPSTGLSHGFGDCAVARVNQRPKTCCNNGKVACCVAWGMC